MEKKVNEEFEWKRKKFNKRYDDIDPVFVGETRTEPHLYVFIPYSVWAMYKKLELTIIGSAILMLFAVFIRSTFIAEGNYIDPFVNEKKIFIYSSILLIALLLIFNLYFILKHRKQERIENEICFNREVDILVKLIIFFDIVITIIILINFCLLMSHLFNNVNDLKTLNPEIFRDSKMDFAWKTTPTADYMTPIIVRGIILILIAIEETVVDIVLYGKMKKRDEVKEKTDVMFDEVENVKR